MLVSIKKEVDTWDKPTKIWAAVMAVLCFAHIVLLLAVNLYAATGVSMPMLVKYAMQAWAFAGVVGYFGRRVVKKR